ncbi:hypothetical protein [Stenotrophomonas muris]|uniref:hypothetical protein n=1 Tax=Stenotrophomonas muris TaxID=2963283 RepID=UPI0039C5E7A2
MTTSVDVLEVMRKSANVASMNALDHGGNVLMNFADDCEAARTAVAELIETVGKHLFAIRQRDEAMNDGINVQGAVSAAIGTEEMLRVALARVKGA